jgi:hypothetical protein
MLGGIALIVLGYVVVNLKKGPYHKEKTNIDLNLRKVQPALDLGQPRVDNM